MVTISVDEIVGRCGGQTKTLQSNCEKNNLWLLYKTLLFLMKNTLQFYYASSALIKDGLQTD